MRYGNCLIGVGVLAVRHRFRGRVVVWNRHLYWKTKGGWYEHYRVVRDVMPDGPLQWLVFRGEFVRQSRLYTTEVERVK